MLKRVSISFRTAVGIGNSVGHVVLLREGRDHDQRNAVAGEDEITGRASARAVVADIAGAGP